MEVIIATIVGMLIIGAIIFAVDKVPVEIFFWGAILLGFFVISFAVGSTVTDLLNITNFYKDF